MLQFTSTIVSNIDINPTQQEAFFEAFPAAPTDHEISVYMDLNHAFAGLPLPYARTDTNSEDITVDSNATDTNVVTVGDGTPGQIVEKYGQFLREAAYRTLVRGVKRHWDNLANLAPASQNNFHYEQVRYALEHLFDGGDRHALNDSNGGGVTYISNVKTAQWVKAYHRDVDAAEYSAGLAPTAGNLAYNVFDTNGSPVQSGLFYDNTIPPAVTSNYLISTDTNNSYGDLVFDEDQIVELLDAASDAGKFRLKQYYDGSGFVTYRALDLEENESFAVRVKVSQKADGGDNTNVAHWLVKLIQRSSTAVNDPKDSGARPLHIVGLLKSINYAFGQDTDDDSFIANLETVTATDSNGTVAPHDPNNYMGNNLDQDHDTNENDSNL